jgi:predicted AAA+ superfamily ATPase
LLGATRDNLLRFGPSPGLPGAKTLFGALFESLAVQTVRVLAERLGARASHFRTNSGEHEVDVIVERDDWSFLTVEVKLSGTVEDRDVRHLNWLARQLPDRIVDRIVINAGPLACRRPDGVGVVPLALLGP